MSQEIKMKHCDLCKDYLDPNEYVNGEFLCDGCSWFVNDIEEE